MVILRGFDILIIANWIQFVKEYCTIYQNILCFFIFAIDNMDPVCYN
jgi:hypothetical protein